ncbi:MAG: GWxTD domain-containing protein [Candidatus Eisenbacteria bacterium]
MHRPATIVLLVAGLIALPALPPAHAATSRERQAEALVISARRHLATDTFDGRRTAIRELEQATLMLPRRPDLDLLLARTYIRAGYLGLARHQFEKVKNFAPEDAEARFGLGQVWRYDWLKYLDLESRDRAVEQFRAAARLAPKRADASIMLVPLLVERSDLTGASEAARTALQAEPNRLDAILADAYTSYRLGRTGRADSAFARAVPRLPRALKDRFEDIRPVASPRDTVALRHLWPAQAAAFTRRFWRQQDPDLASAENEAQLEYWSRVAHAYLLYYDARRQVWDERGEIYVRYGAPGRQIYNGPGEALSMGLTPGSRMPMNVLEWDYPELGMRVKMQDRMLNGFYLPQLEVGLIHASIVEPLPNPDSLARRVDLMGIGGGRGVFPRVPPGTRLLPVDGAIARFEGETGPRLLAGFEAPGGPGDSLMATWVVRDSNDFEVARVTRALVPSACAPTETQVADFAADLTPGRYQIGITIVGSERRRGVFRERLVLEAPTSALTLSDLVVSCGVPDAASIDPEKPSVRIEPNPSARVTQGEPLTAYFEIGHLRHDADGLARFELEYSVRSLQRDSRIWVQRLLAPKPVPSPIRTSRTEQQIGALRRQFVSVPLHAMPPGRYRLEVRVRDLVSGESAGVFTDFAHEAPGTRSGDAAPAGNSGATTASR